MQLYKMELYKLFCSKIFKIGLLAVTGLMLLYFGLIEVGEERAVTDKTVYSGYEAVQMNRKITEEFEGKLTDEKVEQIIEKYGLPSKLEENMPGWRDGNFLNDFVTRYFTDGAWETGTIPTKRYLLSETELGKACDTAGITPYLTYTTGWKVFVEMLQFGLVLGSIWIICSMSGIFAEESQTNMLPLIFCTKEGKQKDVSAKVLAAFTFVLCIFLWILLTDFVLCRIIYGLPATDNLAWMVLSGYIRQPLLFSQYMGVLLGLACLAFLSLGAMTLCISACQNRSFGAVVIAAVCWGFPVLLRMFFGGLLAVFVDAMPVFLIMTDVVNDILAIWKVIVWINLCLAAGCLAKGIITYKKKQPA